MNDNPSPLQEETVPLKSRIWISGADAATAILQALVAAGALTYYFTELRGLSLELAGVVWLLFGIWNAVNDPLFGYISDRTKSGLGRRRPYIRYGAPIFALGFILFWVYIPGSEGNQTLLFIQMLLALFIFDTLYTAIATSIYIMPYEMAISNKARGTIYIWKIIFMVFTLVVPLALEATVKPDVGDVAGIARFRWIMIAFGVGMTALIFISTYFYKEKHFAQAEQQPPFVTAFKECFKNRSFLVFETISFTIIFAQTALMQGLWVYFDEIDVPGTPLYIALALGIVAGVLLWIRQRDRWGIKRSTQIMALLFAIGCFSLLLGGQHLIPATLGFLLFGFGFAGGMYLIPLMNGDVVDYDEHRTGLRREGMYAGINSFITKPAISLAQWALLTILAAFGYDQALASGLQSAQAETGILVGWVAPTGVLLLLCFFALRWYPLAGDAWEQVKASLAAAHAEKERKYLEEIGYRYVE
ncbi:MAG: MFS transporter [Anaerolineae bacterium]|jgi:GPH family glycoside/pentoside/hexuronide:cation symporter|nr:MFS transporter [Anaerolineae bacterium]